MLITFSSYYIILLHIIIYASTCKQYFNVVVGRVGTSFGNTFYDTHDYNTL